MAVSSALAALAQASPLLCGDCGPDGRPGCREANAFPTPLSAKSWEVNKMKLAVTYENGQVFQHFGHCEQFKVYSVEEGSVRSSQVVSAAGSGHGALAGFLQNLGVDTLICGGIGGGARTALAQAGIELYPGASGNADEAVDALLKGNLAYDPDTMCNHHHEGGEHSCHGHGGSCSH